MFDKITNMKKTLLPTHSIPKDIPSEFMRVIGGADVYDSSCSPEARVYFIDRDGGYYLKRSAVGTLKKEAELNAYFHKKGLGPEVLGYISADRDWLFTRSVVGEDCTHSQYLSEPKRLCDLLATRLRELHELDATDCPVQNRMESYFSLAEENFRAGRYDTSYFTDIYGDASADGIHATLMDGKGMYTDKHHHVLLTCVKNRQLTQFRQIVKEVDENAFVIINDSIEVRGKGFKEWDKT